MRWLVRSLTNPAVVPLWSRGRNSNRLLDIKRSEAEDIIAFSTTLLKIRYNSLYKLKTFKPGNKVFLRLYYGYTLLNVTNRKLLNQRAGPFKVIRKISYLAYELELLSTIKIYNIISVA